MPSNAPDLNFGPSQRYLPGKKLLEGDVLTYRVIDFSQNEVDTDFGSKLEFHLHVLSSSTDAVKPGHYTWRTICKAAQDLHRYFTSERISSEVYSTWVFELTVVENGVSLKTLNSDSNQSESITTHGTPAPGNTAAGDGEA